MAKGLDITAFVFSLLFFIPFLPTVGVILGIISLVKSSKNKEESSGFAIAAIAIGIFTTILSSLVLTAIIWSFTAATLSQVHDKVDTEMKCFGFSLIPINCNSANGEVTVSVNPGGDMSGIKVILTLADGSTATSSISTIPTSQQNILFKVNGPTQENPAKTAKVLGKVIGPKGEDIDCAPSPEINCI